MKNTFSGIVYHIILAISLLSIVSCGRAPTPSAMQTAFPISTITQTAFPSITVTQTSLPASTTTPVPTVVPQLKPIKVNSLGFTVDNKPFRFIGANTLNFGFYKEYGLSIDEAIRSAKENGISVIRITVGLNKGTWGGRPFEEYDKVLDIAAKHGMYVIVNLGEGCCMTGKPGETREMYLERFPFVNMTSQSALSDFEEFIQSVLLRKNTANGHIYRDDSTVLAWDVMNEPAVELFTTDELHAWLGKVTTYIKTLDPNHLITIGINTSPGIYSTPGAHFQALNVPSLDFFSFHYNTLYSSKVGSQLDSIRYRVEMLRSLGKPVVMEEFGAGSQRIFPDNVTTATLDDWLRAYKDQLDTAFSSGASGALFWGWGVPETKKVLLWWRQEDHDSSETEFTKLIREYEMPPELPTLDPAATIVTPQPTQAVPPDFYVYAFCTLIGKEKQTFVAPGTPVVILWGWKASTATQLQDYLDNDITTVTLDGKNISAHAPNGIASSEPGNFRLLWFAQVGMLSGGTHKIVFDESWKKMINDGADTYGPGGKYETQHDDCEIVVR